MLKFCGKSLNEKYVANAPLNGKSKRVSVELSFSVSFLASFRTVANHIF